MARADWIATNIHVWRLWKKCGSVVQEISEFHEVNTPNS